MKNLSILLINMENSEHYSKLENLYHNHPLNQFFNAELKIYDKKAKLTFPVSKKLFHAAEAVHGAVYFKALDDAAFFAANSIVEED